MFELLGANWVWILFIVVFIAMHRGGHGCGGHSHRHESGQATHDAPEDRDATSRQR